MDYIPLFGLEENVRGTVYPMLNDFGEGAGSVELSLKCACAKEVKMKVYPHIIHYLKVMGVNMEMPKTMYGMKTRLGKMKLLMSLHNAHPTLLCGFRAEFEVWVSASIDDAHMIVNSYNFNDGTPDGVCVRKRIKVEEYLKQLEVAFKGQSTEV